MHDDKNLLLSTRAKWKIGLHHDQKTRSTQIESQISIMIAFKTVKIKIWALKNQNLSDKVPNK